MRIKGGGIVLAAVLAAGLTGAPVEGQRGPGFRGQAAGPFAGQSLDVLLEHQEALQLEAGQVAELTELKTVLDNDVNPLAEEMRGLREQIRTGEVDRAEGFRQLQAIRGELMTAAAPLRGRIQEILTVEQHRKLQGLVRENRPGMGRGFPGPRGGRGLARPGAMTRWQGRAYGSMGRAGRAPTFPGMRGRFFPGPGRMQAPGFRRGGFRSPWFQPNRDSSPGGEPGEPVRRAPGAGIGG